MRVIGLASLVLVLSTACATTGSTSSSSTSAVQSARVELAPLQPVGFTSGAGSLATSADYMRVGQAVQRLEQDEDAVLLLAGYSDASGSAEANLRLSQSRADLVRSLLLASGVAAERVIAKGMGELPDTGNPVADRRVEFVFASEHDGVADEDELLAVLRGARDAGEDALADADGGWDDDEDDGWGDDDEDDGWGSDDDDDRSSSSSRKSKSKSKSKGSDDEVDRTPMETVGLADIDSLFTRVQDLRDILWNTSDALIEAQQGLNDALGLAEDVAATDAMERLYEIAGDSMTVSMSGGKPTIKPTGNVPDEARRAIDAANKLVSASTKATTNLAQLPSKAQALVAEAKALPAKVPTMAKDAGLSLGEIGQATKAVKTNVKLTAQFPGELNDTIGAAKDLVSTVSGGFADAG